MNPLERLVQAFKALPGVGPRAAQRLAFHVLQHDKPAALELGESLLHALNHIQHCSQCNTFTHLDVCELCADPKRDARLLCVVETPADLWAIEQTQTYRGYYYVLMGKASPLDGAQPKALTWPKLAARLEQSQVEEVILATNFTNEGEATAAFLTEQLKKLNMAVSRLARGVPIGAELEYTDPLTVARAMADRR